MIPLTFRSHSEKPWQPGHPKRPSDKAIAHSAQGRLATHLPLATHLAGRRMSSYYKSDLRCASLSAHESGIFCFLFFAVEKKEVAARRRHRRSQRIEGNPRGGKTKRFRRAIPDPYRTSVPHSSLMGGRIRKNKNQIGITRWDWRVARLYSFIFIARIAVPLIETVKRSSRSFFAPARFLVAMKRGFECGVGFLRIRESVFP